MGWLTDTKSDLRVYIVTTILALVTLLSGVVYRAVPSRTWDTISDSTPKKALWAAVALLGISTTLEFAYIFDLRKKLKPKTAAPITPTLRQALAHLRTLSNNLPAGNHPNGLRIAEYHQTLNTVEQETGHSLRAFRITPGDLHGTPPQYCDRDVFLMKVRGALELFK